MPEFATFAIVVRSASAVQLQQGFGEQITRQALQHLDSEVAALLQRLLGQFQVLAKVQQGGEGLWAALFAPHPSALPRHAQELCASLQAAGQQLLREAVLQVFGGGAGMRLPAAVQVGPLSQGEWSQWQQHKEALFPAVWAVEEKQSNQPQTLTHQAFEAMNSDDSVGLQIQALLRSDQALRTLLQPIVRFADRRVVGYEALTRGPAGSPLERPDQLFAAAQASGYTVPLELHCAALALQRTARRLPEGRFLTINLGPQALLHWAQQPQSLSLEGHSKVVVELTEHLPLDQTPLLRQSLDALRQRGIGLALDDTGCGFADLAMAQALRPDIVKLCITVVQHLASDDKAHAELGQAVAQLHGWGCQVLAEGVETEAEHQALARYGLALAQGWLYGKPQPWERVVVGPVPKS